MCLWALIGPVTSLSSATTFARQARLSCCTQLASFPLIFEQESAYCTHTPISHPFFPSGDTMHKYLHTAASHQVDTAAKKGMGRGGHLSDTWRGKGRRGGRHRTGQQIRLITQTKPILCPTQRSSNQVSFNSNCVTPQLFIHLLDWTPNQSPNDRKRTIVAKGSPKGHFFQHGQKNGQQECECVSETITTTVWTPAKSILQHNIRGLECNENGEKDNENMKSRFS